MRSSRMSRMAVDASALQLNPTDGDIAGLHADGYLAELIAELRDAQGDGTDAGVHREALVILADVLGRQQGGVA